MKPPPVAPANSVGIQTSPTTLGDGTPATIITSEKSKTATAEERKAAVDRLMAPAAGATTDSGVSADSLKAEMVRDYLARYPKLPADVLAPIADEYHRQCVLLARRSNGSISPDYYRKQMAMRLDGYISNSPQYQ